MQESDSDGIIEHELSFDPCKATYVKIKVISERVCPIGTGMRVRLHFIGRRNNFKLMII